MPRIRAASIDEHKELTRHALIDAAYSLIAEAGTADIPLGEIALAAGVGRTTFYDYFHDRDDVIAALVERELPGVLSKIIESVETSDAKSQLAALASATVEFVASDPVFGVILHAEVPRLGARAQERIQESHEQLATEMAGLYARGVAEGVFRSIPPFLAGRFIQDTIMSAAKALIDDTSRAEVVTDELEKFLLGGLGQTTR